MKKLVVLFPLFFTLLPALVWASPPVPFSGKVAIDGVNFHGQAQFAFAIRDQAGTVHWRNGATANDAITVNVANGRYVVLLGGQGMNPLPASLFANHDELYLRVRFDKGDGQGLVHLAPDQRITAVPYAKVVDMVKPGAITTAQLNEQILKYLKPEITVAPQAPGLFSNGQTITLNSQAQGKFLTYQWRKDGQPIAGATNSTLTIASFNGALHNGNYTLVVSNDFGSVTTQPTNLQVDTVASIGMQMIFCPPGTFMMGSPSSETGRDGDETQHQVTLTNGFYLGKYEVTQAQYETVMTGNPEGLNAKPSNWLNNPNRPVEKVSWNDAQIFLTRLNSMEQTAGRLPAGWKYVLPTEAEWEYACRAGTTTIFSWGNSAASTQANFKGTHPYGGGATGPNLQQTTDVGHYAANPWGFFDMHGNVWEWTADWYQAAYLGGAQTNPEGPASGSYRVLRGGSWGADGTRLRSAERTGAAPSAHNYDPGFRVAFQAIQPDVANPEFTLSGTTTVTHSQGMPFVDPGYEAHDVRDGNLTSSVTVTGTVDVNSTGTYVLTYSVADAAGNTASATRTVTVTGNRSVDLNATVAMDMLWVSPGSFTMGSPTTEPGRKSDQEDEHNVTLTKGFYLGKYEVTQAQYEAVIGSNPSEFNATGNGNRPVEKVSWTEATAFCTQLTTLEQNAGRLPAGWAYVLPTESEWEYVCRAGTTTAYSWGATIASSNANYFGSGLSQTRDVGQYAANPWGFYDIHGNVKEWVADRYQVAYPTSNPVIDPTGPASGSSRANRGGSWFNTGPDLRSARRYNHPPSTLKDFLGFRVAFRFTGGVPQLSLVGDANATHLAGMAWVDPGATATDAEDGNLTAQVTVSGTVDANATGAYQLTYLATDSKGNSGIATRTVNVTGARSVDLNVTVAMDMLWIPAGTFTMGSPTTETGREADREDEHNVTLTKGFYLGKYEVTQVQYEAVMTGNTNSLSPTPSEWPGNPNRPVEKVSWDDAQVFLTRLNAQQAANLPAGWAYVLPTESQWEYACRAGTTTVYSWGATIASSNANYNWDGAYNTGSDYKQTRDVGQYAANLWGFFDMHGNVWEWTADRYQAAYPTGNPVIDPTGPASGSTRVSRGGSWNRDGTILRSAQRGYVSPGLRYGHLGFRVGFQKQ